MRDDKFDPSRVYESLPDNSIRILVLEPGNFQDPLQGHLRVQKVDTHGEMFGPAYEALSYTWGEAHNTHHISCSGGHIPIRQNLHDALQYLRPVDKPRNLWIDALCINQNDNAEKAIQVSLMRYVYLNALQVLIWLGLETPSTLRGLELIKHGTECARVEHLESWHERPPKTPWDEAESVARGFPSRNGPDGDGLLPVCEFLSLRYFSRVWIIQEIIYAKSAVLLLGRQTIDYGCFFTALNFFSAKSYAFVVKGENLLAQFHIFRPLSRIGNDNLKVRTADLHLLLKMTRDFQATDRRDKVFGLLGLLNRGAEFTVDYQASYEEIYTRAADLILEERMTNIFELFSEVQHDAHSFDEGLASWVPRWYIPLVISRISLRTFQANGLMAVPSHITDKSLDTLRLKGIVVGKITQHNSSNNISRFDMSKRSLLQTWHLLTSACRFFPQNEPYLEAGETWYEVLAEVLTIGDRVPSRKDQSGYLAWHFQFLFCYIEIELRKKGKEFENELSAWTTEVSQLKRLLKSHSLFETDELNDFWYEILQHSVRRKIFRIEKGNLGLGPDCLLKEDLVCIIYGGRVPYILRPAGEDRFRFVGECYLHGYMHGEALQDGQVETQTFEIF